MQTRHHTTKRLASALAAIAIMAIARDTMPAAAVFDQESERLAQEKISVMQAADNIAPWPMSASVKRDPMIIRKDMAATLRQALPESPRLEFLGLVFGMLFVTVGGLLAIYFVDRKNAPAQPVGIDYVARMRAPLVTRRLQLASPRLGLPGLQRLLEPAVVTVDVKPNNTRPAASTVV